MSKIMGWWPHLRGWRPSPLGIPGPAAWLSPNEFLLNLLDVCCKELH